MSDRHLGAQAGFTLVELLVSLAILSISIAVLVGVIGENLRHVERARQDMLATAMLRSLLDQVGTTVPLQDGDTAGAFPGGFLWRLQIQPYSADGAARTSGIAGKRIRASIRWGRPGDLQSRSLETVRTAPPDTVP